MIDRHHSPPERPKPGIRLRFLLALLAGIVVTSCGQDLPVGAGHPLPGLSYTNYRVARAPWSIHVVELNRTNPLYRIHSVHADGKALGLETLSDQVAGATLRIGPPMAAINGDFYDRDGSYAGAPRGLQISDGELLSAPSGGVTFWVDALGAPQLTNVDSRFEITWPDGSTTPFTLNAARRSGSVVLFTPACGASTHTSGGRELVLAKEGGAWLPLQIGRTISARVVEVRDNGNTRLKADAMVLSLGSSAIRRLPAVETGAVLRISTASIPSLRGARTALSGGPILVHQGRRPKIRPPSSAEGYEATSMLERHPRSAIGWGDTSFFLVEVDGRQRSSVGMTLDELASFMAKLGCTEAMNLDGGGSATLWFDRHVRNNPCDRMEREIANGLVISRKPMKDAAPGAVERD